MLTQKKEKMDCKKDLWKLYTIAMCNNKISNFKINLRIFLARLCGFPLLIILYEFSELSMIYELVGRVVKLKKGRVSDPYILGGYGSGFVRTRIRVFFQS